jgi:uncharacterized integral membrane protein
MLLPRNRNYNPRAPFPIRKTEAAMRWLYLTIVVLFAAGIVIFAIQNLDLVTMSFLGFSLRAPLALLAAIVYVLGAVTGGSLFALLRRSLQESKAG